METALKKTLRAISLELRHVLEGNYDSQGQWQAGDIERRLNEIGVWRDRSPKSVDELPHLSDEDKKARRIVDAYVNVREEAGVERAEAIAEFVRESAYTWANRLFALRCMEARGIIDEVILQKDAYGGRSMVHQRFARKNPDACAGEDDGLFAVLMDEFEERAKDLPHVFDPKSPALAPRPSTAAIKRCIALLSGRESVRNQESATDAVFETPDSFGWAYQYWNSEEKDRIFEKVRTQKGAKIEGVDVIPATQIYTEPYMVKFLVQNSLGATWMGMHPESKLYEGWEYYVRDADCSTTEKIAVSEITCLDPAVGSGHFLLEAFDLFYEMYREEGADPAAIAASILNNNLFAIDIDGRAIQIACTALWMKGKEKAPNLRPSDLVEFHDHVVATNIRLPRSKDHLEVFLKKHPEDEQLRPALESVFEGLENADELGSLLQIEEPVERELRRLKEQRLAGVGKGVQTKMFSPTVVQGELPVDVESYEQWKRRTLERLKEHFEEEAEAVDLVQAFFGEEAGKGLALFDLLTRRYDVVVANPPYMGFRKFGSEMVDQLKALYPSTYIDLYTAFIQQACRLLSSNGRVGIVSLNTWLTLDAFSAARQEIFGRTTINIMAVLGTGTFRDLSNTNAMGFCMFILDTVRDLSRISLFLDCTLSDDKQSALISRLKSLTYIRRRHSDFASIPGQPIAFAAPDSILKAFAENEPLGSRCVAKQGLKTGDNNRLVRFVWECPPTRWNKRWYPCTRGGEYRRWRGNYYAATDWEANGIRIRSFTDSNGNLRSRPQNVDAYFREGITWTTQTSYGFSARKVDKGLVVESAGPLAIPHKEEELMPLLGIVNCRLVDFLFNLIQPNVGFGEGYFEKLPLPRLVQTELNEIGKRATFCVETARLAEVRDLTSTYAELQEPRNPDLRTLIRGRVLSELGNDALRHTMEAETETLVSERFGLRPEEFDVVYRRVGRPAGWFPLIAGYDAWPETRVETSPESSENWVTNHGRIMLTTADMRSLKRRLKAMYEAGPGLRVGREEQGLRDDTNQADSPLREARDSQPTETFLECLAVTIEVHPVSVYWLLKEGQEWEGWDCPPRAKYLTEDTFTLMTLCLLGHRWPKQIEADEPIQDYADRDGIIPISDGSGEDTLCDRVRRRIPEEFPGGDAASIEREFEAIVGIRLGRWLAGPFFKRHISQFKKRPIAWQIESGPVAATAGRMRRGVNSRPAFSCLVYYHKLDGDLIPKIRAHCVSPLQKRYETELRTLEAISGPSPDQQARKIELANWIQELKTFHEKLREVSTHGFGPEHLLTRLRQNAVNDAMLALKTRWLQKLAGVIQAGPLGAWDRAATETDLHPELPLWIRDAISNLNHHCSAVEPRAPDEKSFATDPDPGTLASIICKEARSMATRSVELACSVWWGKFYQAVLRPLREEISEATAKITELGEELPLTEPPIGRSREREIKREIKLLKLDIEALKKQLAKRSGMAQPIRDQIEGWSCPDAEHWEGWLASQPLYDEVASVDGRRAAPKTIAEFIAQESAYIPDINDGVRVNIAPLQRIGLLSEDVLARKDVDEAIADRAEWRADERRWCREGKLPKPGWWS